MKDVYSFTKGFWLIVVGIKTPLFSFSFLAELFWFFGVLSSDFEVF